MTEEDKIKNEKCQKLPIVHRKKIEWKGGSRKGDVITLAYPDYSGEVSDWLHALYDLGLNDMNCHDRYEELDNQAKEQGKKITELELSRDDILAVMTYYTRAERFCGGVLAQYTEDGTLEELGIRLREMTAQTGEE